MPTTAVPSPRRRERSRGQSLAEFAIVFPVLFLIIAGIIQFGLIFWAQNTLTQVARDTGRWAATQQDPCHTPGEQAAAAVKVEATANSIAASSALLGFDGAFDAGEVTVSWSGNPCPPNDNTQEAWVTIGLEHDVPVFFPFVPGNGHIGTSTEFRMEPEPK